MRDTGGHAVRRGDEFDAVVSELDVMAGRFGEELGGSRMKNATLEAVLGGMSECVLVLDAEGRVVLANGSMRAAFGVGGQTLTGRPYLEVVRNVEVARLIGEASARGAAVTAEVEIHFPPERSFTGGCVPLIVDGISGGTVLVLHDITRLKALERVRRDFFANVSHEIKSPITSIMGYAELLGEAGFKDDAEAREFLRIIINNSERVARLTEDILTISRIETDEVVLEPREVPLADICAEVAASLAPQADGKCIALSVDVPEEASRVIADRDAVYRVVLNVVGNAVKYTPEGGRVSVAARGPENGVVALVVEDTGIGIPPELLPRIGERFFRVDSADSRKTGGTGLGMAIVKHLMKAVGGAFSMDSVPNRGTTVTLSFKAAGRGRDAVAAHETQA